MASVDDLEELIATRKLNGLNDDLYKENNIEEDIKTLKEELENECKRLDNYLETHKDYFSDEANMIRKNIYNLQDKIKLFEECATEKEENVVDSEDIEKELSVGEIIDKVLENPKIMIKQITKMCDECKKINEELQIKLKNKQAEIDFLKGQIYVYEKFFKSEEEIENE